MLARKKLLQALLVVGWEGCLDASKGEVGRERAGIDFEAGARELVLQEGVQTCEGAGALFDAHPDDAWLTGRAKDIKPREAVGEGLDLTGSQG
ncbi:MAG TPA: hypothetical protein VGU68_05305, partial [Ktedonobacteraceae bacterium]|nr:hypothetical protein [Ktedonobacteraceae bacterium]